ncbi:MAG: GH36 C-terminal domain-containing protein [Dorea sp.]
MEHLVQSGDYYRLVNPFENNNHVLWQFVSKDKKETVVCGVRLHSEANPYIYLFYPQGLDADMKYEDTATGKVYTGAALMKAGLPLPLTTGDYQPVKFTFRAVEK